MRLGPCALLACVLVLGCQVPNDGVARATDWARPHLAQFAQFDRWARRAGASDAVLQNRDALGETTFARIRRDDAVAAAWVSVDGERAFTLALPAKTELPSNPEWTTLRDPTLGVLRVARFADCARVVPASKARPASACVLISRADTTPPNRTTTVTLAFREPPAAMPAALPLSDQSKPR